MAVRTRRPTTHSPVRTYVQSTIQAQDESLPVPLGPSLRHVSSLGVETRTCIEQVVQLHRCVEHASGGLMDGLRGSSR